MFICLFVGFIVIVMVVSVVELEERYLLEWMFCVCVMMHCSLCRAGL